ncbi:synaptic vesicle membrane protein VAT-1 homolog [Periplaneta americana]|uniref:synaptic vesicle membrane protein VAT-1 homolog n=1 Tax=Periplaneta americana TaxID=6978 RepID=UPI0037E8207D
MEEVRSVVVTEFGGYDCIKVKPWPLQRALGAGDVEVAVAMCGMNFADLYTRQGLLRTKKPPFVLGIECAGQVTAVADDVVNVKVGDRVICYQYTGDLYRERVVIAASQCFVLPPDVNYEHGAALAVNYLTAYFCVLDVGHLRPGQSVFIPSCAGGVGWAATQLARSVESVTIFGTCSASKKEAVRGNGVTHALDHDSYEQELLKICPEGVDVVIDSMGGSAFATSQRLLKPLGRVVLIGSNSVVTDDRKLGMWSLLRMWWSTKSIVAMDLLMHNRVVAGLHLGLLLEQQPARVRAAMDHVLQLYAEGKVKPKIDSIWPLDKIVEATKVLAERRNVGKVLLKVEPTNNEEEKA